METIVETIRGTWDNLLGRALILAAIAGGPFFYFLSLVAAQLPEVN